MDIATWKSTALPLAKNGLAFLTWGEQDTQNAVLPFSLPPASLAVSHFLTVVMMFSAGNKMYIVGF